MAISKQPERRTVLTFVRKILEIADGYSPEDLYSLRRYASRHFPVVAPVVDAYLNLAQRGEDELLSLPQSAKRQSASQMHLFDLLRSRQLFPQNSDLAEFAARILPNMSTRRFDKMSRGDIAARVIEYLETLSPDTRRNLEESMRDALKQPKSRQDPATFFSRWESIIKGV